jgi:hypothetical protein
MPNFELRKPHRQGARALDPRQIDDALGQVVEGPSEVLSVRDHVGRNRAFQANVSPSRSWRPSHRGGKATKNLPPLPFGCLVG